MAVGTHGTYIRSYGHANLLSFPLKRTRKPYVPYLLNEKKAMTFTGNRSKSSIGISPLR